MIEQEFSGEVPTGVRVMTRKHSDSGKSIDTTQLRDLLLRRSPDGVNRWLETQEPGDANPFLRDIAKDAERINGAALFGRSAFNMTWQVALLNRALSQRSVVLFFLAVFIVLLFGGGYRKVRRNRAGVRAAALLAERGDEYAFLPLAKVWGAWDRNRILSDEGERNFGAWLAEQETLEPALLVALHRLLKRSYPPLMRFDARDFSDAHADILLAALRCLARDPDSLHATLRRVARFPVPTHAPNRALLREMAILFLDDPTPVVALERPNNAAFTVSPVMPPINISTTNATTSAPEQETVRVRQG